MSVWKQKLNASLIRTTGHRLERADKGGSGTKAKAKPSRTPQGSAPSTPGKRAAEFPEDYDDETREIIRAVRPYTMTSPDKLHALVAATRYVHKHAIPGAIVECGVWRGGSMHASARVLDGLGSHDRDLYLFDTFEGMPPPTERDQRLDGRTAQSLLDKSERDATIWAYASLDDVQEGFKSVPYPDERVHFVRGKVEETIPQQAPEQIALLRLDTDWYESTRHEFEHLYPRLVSGGVLILDDYGWWKGAREATEEFLAESGERLLLVRAGTGRIAVKP